MKFAAKRNPMSPADVLDGEESSWEDLDQMRRLKVQIYVDLAYLKAQMEAIMAMAINPQYDASKIEPASSSEWLAFWEGAESDYISDDGQPMLKAVA